jgi:hypothetical protein
VNRKLAGAIGGLLGLATLAAWAIAGSDPELGSRAPEDRPMLALLTSLPLMFGERFGLMAADRPR